MRILDLNNSYSPDGGGIRVYHDEKVTYYAEGKHDYGLMVPGRRKAVTRKGRSTVFELPSVNVPRTASRFVVRPGLISGLVDDFRPDLIEIGSVEILPLYLAYILRRRPVATVAFFHQDYPVSYIREPLARISRPLGAFFGDLAERHARWLYGGATAAFATSGFAVSRLREIGVRRIIHTPLGVDTAVFNPSRRSEALRRELGAGSRRLVLFAGRLATEKGIDILIEAWRRMRDRDRFILVVAGHGPQEKVIETFCASHPEVRRLPHLNDRTETARLMASADLFLSLGRRETFSLATLEAMACGTPVVTAATGGAAELVKAAGGPASYDGTAAGLALSITENAFGGRAASAEALAAHVRRHYDWGRALDRITDAYERVRSAFSSGSLDSLDSTSR